MLEKPKNRRITRKDWDSVAEFIKKTLAARKGNKFRKSAEIKWAEVDRQVAMEALARIKNDPNSKDDSRSAIELGELSRASEVLSADVRRMQFPQNRAWFDPHVEIKSDLDEAGNEIVNESAQQFIDGNLRALMAQQHLDFGLKARHDLSIKEALHHGGYVAEVEEMTMLGSLPNGQVSSIQAPVWVPHSMWNCFPDDAQSTGPGTLFYTGNMIICSYMSHVGLQNVTGKGWIKANIEELDDPKKKDHEIINYYGDIIIKRQDGNHIYLPNVRAKAVKDKLIYYEPNDLPFSRIIYNGYERLDVRDPYYTSPLIKMSPTQKVASVLTNQLIDSIELKIKPPVILDGNDPNFSGGIDLSVNSQSYTRNLANFKVVDIGDPQSALAGLQFELSEIQKGTGVDSIRSGMTSSTEQTATEVERVRQGGQIRTIDFVDKDELHGLRPFLYLQHESNKIHLKSYQFYNPEMDSPDFVRVTNEDLPKNVHFDVVGSKGMIEEEQRQNATINVTRFMVEVGMGNKLDFDKLAKEMYQDAGNKNPERFLILTDEKTASQQLQELQAQMQQLQEQAQQIQIENQELKLHEDSAVEKLKGDTVINLAKEDNKEDEIKTKAANDLEKINREADLKEQEQQNKLILEDKKLENNQQLELFKVFITEETKPEDTTEDEKRSETVKMKALLDNFESTMAQFSKIQAAPKKVIRDDDGFITEVTTETPTLN